MVKLAIASILLALVSPVGAQTAAVPAGLTRIGVAAAVRGVVRASSSGQPVGRVIGSGQPVYLNDHVTTGPDGRLQLLLLDQTTFTVGPNSDMVLDEFVYDPKTGVGTVSAQILKGFFRFVTGKIAQAKPSNMKVRTPVGTIGIRGTMVVGHIDGGDAEIVLIGPGRDNNANERRGGITVSNNFGHTDIDSSGYGVRIRDGGAPSRGFRVSPVEMETILGALAPKYAAGHGGPPDASRTSGDALASGGINYHAWTNLNTITTNFNQTTTYANQQSQNGPDTWADLLSIPSGVAGYQGNANFTCAGSNCGIIGGNTGTFYYAFNVDFGAKTIGNTSPSFQIGSDAVTMNSVSFASFSGKASYTLSPTDAPGIYGNFAGTTLTFLKSGGQPAAALQINMIYNINSSGGTATGTGTAPKGAPVPLS